MGDQVQTEASQETSTLSEPVQEPAAEVVETTPEVSLTEGEKPAPEAKVEDKPELSMEAFLEQLPEELRAEASIQNFKSMEDFAKSLTKLVSKNKKVCIPGYTHLQHAMPIALVEYFYAHLKMLSLDVERLSNSFNNVELTMGSGALVWIVKGGRAQGWNLVFSSALAGTLVLALLLERPLGDLLTEEHDRLSIVHLLVGAIACKLE